MGNEIENPLAFASQSMTADGSDGDKQEGMTLRDYFAAKAMQSQMGNQEHLVTFNKAADGDEEQVMKWIAETSFEMADVMLKERSK